MDGYTLDNTLKRSFLDCSTISINVQGKATKMWQTVLILYNGTKNLKRL